MNITFHTAPHSPQQVSKVSKPDFNAWLSRTTLLLCFRISVHTAHPLLPVMGPVPVPPSSVPTTPVLCSQSRCGCVFDSESVLYKLWMRGPCPTLHKMRQCSERLPRSSVSVC